MSNIRIAILLLGLISISACVNFTPKAEEPFTGFAKYPKNIVLIIGDGMGLSQISKEIIDNAIGHYSYFNHIGFQKTASADRLVTDSAAGATAMACGVKTNNNWLAMTPDSVVHQTILELAAQKGKSTGLVVSSPLNHATPAAFYAHGTSRWTNFEIAQQFVSSPIDFFVGGGKSDFEQKEADINLMQVLRQKGYYICSSADLGFAGFNASIKRPFGCFTAEKKPGSAYYGRDYLPSASEAAMKYLSKRSNNGFFLMIEASQIDWACHANNQDILFKELTDLDQTVSEVLQFALRDKETLVILTADHETGGFSLNAGSKSKKWKSAFETNGHTATMIPVFACGPQAALFEGVYENTEIYFKMRKAFFPQHFN